MFQQGYLVTVARLHEKEAAANLGKPSDATLGGIVCGKERGSGSKEKCHFLPAVDRRGWVQLIMTGTSSHAKF